MFEPARRRDRRRGTRPRLRPALEFREVLFSYSYAATLQADAQAAQLPGCYQGIDRRLADLQPRRRLPYRHRSILRCLEHVVAHLGNRPVQGGEYYFFNLGMNNVLRGVDAPVQIDDLCGS